MQNKKTYLALLLTVCIGFSLVLMSCDKAKAPDETYYTCPMHPQIKMETEGQCPICGMDLVPVKEFEKHERHFEHQHHSTQQKKSMTVKINPRYVQNIGVITETVKKRDLTKEIQTYGKVAHDHKLWVAQNEYIESLKLGDKALIQASERKLRFLGLSEEWINTIKQKRSADIALHLETQSQPTFFEAFVYQEDIALIKEGLNVMIQDHKGRFLANGKLKSIGTLVDLNSRSVRVLIMSEESLNLKLNTFIQVKIKVPLGRQLSVSQEAILFNGNNTMVYVEKKPGIYEARKIEIGQKAANYYEITSGLQAEETVVTNGHFLIDSESKIKMGSMQGHNH